MTDPAVTLDTAKRRASWERAFNQLPFRCRLQITQMLDRHSGAIPTLKEIQQIPSDVFNAKRPNFGITSRRQIYAWLRLHGVTSGPIFGTPDEIDQRIV
jgi:hypothetical protein